MIASLRGRISSKKPEGVTVDVGGVGYFVHVPLCSICNIPEPGGEVFLHTYTHVREDALQLYGFLTEEERERFILLIGISGIGPRLGLAILSGMPADRFTEAVCREDVSLLMTIPGLGKKTASRLILELRGKLPALDHGDNSGRQPFAGDAVSALVNLGYRKPLSEKAVERAVTSGARSLEDLIRESLQYLTGNTRE